LHPPARFSIAITSAFLLVRSAVDLLTGLLVFAFLSVALFGAMRFGLAGISAIPAYRSFAAHSITDWLPMLTKRGDRKQSENLFPKTARRLDDSH
jgi:hypothetical protein